MDFLNSLLNSMDKPPAANEEEKKLIKRQREMAERLKIKHRDEMKRFRTYVEERMERFARDERPYIEFQPLDKVHRALIHEVAECGGFIVMSFGREDIDRHSVVYKKEHPPSEDEIAARRNGDGWNEQIAKDYAERRKRQQELESERKLARATSVKQTPAEPEVRPTCNYKDKYAHLIGQEAALEAARKTETNKSYGFVPSKNKKDVRSIEQTLADIQAKKRRKLEEAQKQQESHETGQQPLEQEHQTAEPTAGGQDHNQEPQN